MNKMDMRPLGNDRPVAAMAEVPVFVFNFLFLRDFVFGRADDPTRD
ncbi:hypothetical protein [Bradyrhizobium sp.]|nr:hypothetical protein [Bradyrhizobium sp.]MBI5322701.1 hypothetical protein [Bradyrhizobium sp.]